jgi:hypothetical protein
VATAQDKFKDLVDVRLAPWLKQVGFRRRDATFRRQRGDAWQIVNFQRSQHSDSREVPFTINLGVALKLLHDDEPRWARRGWPLEYECDFRQRIGPLWKGEDHWWRVRPLRASARTASDVQRALEGPGLAWLDLHADPEAYLATAMTNLQSVEPINLTALATLARTIGTSANARAAEEELARWERGERIRA